MYFLVYAPVVFSSLGFLGLPVHVYAWIWQLPVNALAGLLGLPVTSVTPAAMSSGAFQLAQSLLFGGIAGVGAAVWTAHRPTIDDRELHHCSASGCGTFLPMARSTMGSLRCCGSNSRR